MEIMSANHVLQAVRLVQVVDQAVVIYVKTPFMQTLDNVKAVIVIVTLVQEVEPVTV